MTQCQKMFSERLDYLPPRLADFSLVPSASDRTEWQELPGDIRARLVAAGERMTDGEWPSLPVTAWLDYSRNGNRTRFEALYFTRRRRLNGLVMAECVEANGRFLDPIINGLMLICEESGWQLPAHNAYIRGGARTALPQPDRPVIDLFAAETGAQLAMAHYLLGDAIEAAAPGMPGRIEHELRRRILDPYLSAHFWWMGNGDERMNNWTAWCTQNVLLTAFASRVPDIDLHAIVRKAAGSLDAFLKDYGEDGACEEGALYYRHAGLCLFNALNLLAGVAPQAFGPLWNAPKIRNMADYIVNAHVEGQRYFNFADCSAVNDRCGAREFLFGCAVGSEPLADFAAADWAEEPAPDLPDEINLFYRVQAAFAANAMREHGKVRVRKPDIFYPSIGLVIARDDRFALAVKAGNNGESHNHNDVGSVTLYKDGTPLLIDVGVESYTARTFSPDRYGIWTMQSGYHNLPDFGGVMQQDGDAFAARDVSVSLEAEQALIAMELAGAYPPDARLRRFRRTVRFFKGSRIELEDQVDGDLPAVLSLMLAVKPSVDDSCIDVGDLARISVSGGGKAEVEEIPVSDPRLQLAWPEPLYRLRLPYAAGRLLLTIV
ncbi:hypothetical protein J2Z17_004384 [Rhizobium halophytocola]|uniref:Heparinase II/III-like C-terminal domain-containing protein n=2 Tax=Rhizobium halophytocola TaxID=735519 RepID=A0ABS4E4Q5_9HYPH|nr:hypothetical protein [Rhizobium halophytocola]